MITEAKIGRWCGPGQGVPTVTGTERPRVDSPLEPLVGLLLLWSPGFTLLPFRTGREETLIVLSHPIVAICYSSPSGETNFLWKECETIGFMSAAWQTFSPLALQ